MQVIITIVCKNYQTILYVRTKQSITVPATAVKQSNIGQAIQMAIQKPTLALHVIAAPHKKNVQDNWYTDVQVDIMEPQTAPEHQDAQNVPQLLTA